MMFRVSLRRPTLILTIIAFMVPLVTYGTLRGSSTRNPEPEITAIPSVESLTGELEVEVITLRPARFEPSEITRPRGAFVLFVDDRSGKENSSLVLQRVNGQQLRAISLHRKKSEWNDVVDLSPGTYLLQDANNSELRCQLTVLP